MENKKKADSLNNNLKQLAEISAWFGSQKEIDIELGLEKVKTAAELIKASKEKLNKLENEFKEIEKEFSQTNDSNPADESVF
jgi:translation elongation factor EF-1beta